MAGDGKRRDMYQKLEGRLETKPAIPLSTKGTLHRQQQSEFSTLDEPIYLTIWRDLKAIGIKFFHVIYPRNREVLLKDWDLWGPLLLCTFMALLLCGSSDDKSKNDGGPEVAEVFILVWVGSIVVTLNSKLLGGKTSFFQSVCVLGYCLLPTTLALIVCRIILFYKQNTVLFLSRLLITLLGFAHATYASMHILGNGETNERKALMMYPIFLFYFVISWLVISHST